MSQPLPSFRVKKGELLQHVSRMMYRGYPLYFGRNGTNRYDDPAQRYGVLYLGFDLPTALMESVFHRHRWLEEGRRVITLQEIQGRMVRATGALMDLYLADLTAPGIMAGYFGLNLEQLASRDYTHTQQISARIHAMTRNGGKAAFDGIRFPSRNNYPAASIAPFERAATKVRVIADIDLTEHVDWPRFVATYRIGVITSP